MKYHVLILFLCITNLCFAQISWNNAQVISSSKTYTPNTYGPFNQVPSRPINVEFTLVNDTLFLVDSFAGNCTDSFLTYEFATIGTDSIQIRKSDSGFENRTCCKHFFSTYPPDSIYFYNKVVQLYLLNSSNTINIKFEGLWYTIQKNNANSLDYFPKYLLTPAKDSVTLGYFHGAPPFKPLFTIDSGYIWFNFSFEATDGSTFYYQKSDKVNDSIYVNSYDGTCNAVTLNFPGHYVSIPLIPCDSLVDTLYVHHYLRHYVTPVNPAIANQYYVTYAPFSNVCDTSSGSLHFQQVFLSVDNLVLSASQNNNSAFLNWDINIDSDFRRFEVLKSITNRNKFVSLGIVDRVATKLNYNFTDDNFIKTSTYKIRGYHLDGSFEESNTVSVRHNGEQTITVSPIPTNALLKFDGLEDSFYKLYISSIDGKIVYSQHLEPISNTTLVDISELPVGMFIVSLNNEDSENILTQKIIKQ